MAITGTGTQADPYIVDTWEDFVTAVKPKGVYVEVKPDTVWDFNDLFPEQAPSIEIGAVRIDGKGLVIKNPRIYGSFITFNTANGNTVTIENLSITNFLADGAVMNKGIGTRQVYCENVVISGVQSSGSTLVHSSGTGGNTFRANENGGCGFSVECRGGDFMSGDTYFNFEDSIFSMSGGHIGHSTSTLPWLYYCYVTGECDSVYMRYNSQNVIVNCITPIAYIRDAGHNAIVNSDRCDDVSGNCTAVTDEQLRDAAYLSSIGFPIGVQP